MGPLRRPSIFYAFQRYCRFYAPARHVPHSTSSLLKFPHVPLGVGRWLFGYEEQFPVTCRFPTCYHNLPINITDRQFYFIRWQRDGRHAMVHRAVKTWGKSGDIGIWNHWKFFSTCFNLKANKKAVLSQRWPRDAPYTWGPEFSGLADYAHGYYSQHFSWSFVPIDPMNVPTKFEFRSFTRSWDNIGVPKKFGQSLDTPTLPFCQNFNGHLFGLAL